MRIRTDGKYARREESIEAAADFWGCNKTRALMLSAEFAKRMDSRIRRVFRGEDLTIEQKREIAQALSIANTYEVEIEEHVDVHLGRISLGDVLYPISVPQGQHRYADRSRDGGDKKDACEAWDEDLQELITVYP